MLRLPLPSPRPPRVVLIGVGSDLRGDDAAGVFVVRRLAERGTAPAGVLFVDGGTAPESFSGPIKRFQPNLVVEIDAAHLGKAPGTVAEVDWRDADGLSASSHTLPPSVLAKYLTAETGCTMVLIGIQPAALEFGAALSPAVQAAVAKLADTLAAWLEPDELRA